MKLTTREIIIWAPRIVGLGLALFLSLFGVDAWSDFRGIVATTIAVVMGFVPALVVLVSVLVGWKHERIAAAIFIGLAAFYALTARDHPEWILVIAGPLALEAILFLASWRFQEREQRTLSAG